MFLPFRASWQKVIRPSTSFPLLPLFIPYGEFSPICNGWNSVLSSCPLPKPFGASFDAEAAVHPFLVISYPGVWNGGCTHRPLAQHGLSCPQSSVLTIDTGFRRFSVQRLVPRQCRQDFGGVAGQERSDGEAEAGEDTAVQHA